MIVQNGGKGLSGGADGTRLNNAATLQRYLKYLNCHLCLEVDIQNENMKKSQKELRRRGSAAELVAILATLK